MSSEFDAIFAANSEYVKGYKSSGLSGRAAKGLAIVTCMDSRIDPLRIVGMSAGDVKILRNAGARVTDDMLRTQLLATYLLEVKRVLVCHRPIAVWQVEPRSRFTKRSLMHQVLIQDLLKSEL
ncbi:MAG: carbonic anhydrase [Actinomycetota bacterium]